MRLTYLLCTSVHINIWPPGLQVCSMFLFPISRHWHDDILFQEQSSPCHFSVNFCPVTEGPAFGLVFLFGLPHIAHAVMTISFSSSLSIRMTLTVVFVRARLTQRVALRHFCLALCARTADVCERIPLAVTSSSLYPFSVWTAQSSPGAHAAWPTYLEYWP